MPLDKPTALAILARANVPAGEDFHRLSTTQVEALLIEADARRYKKPKAANGSRGRSFHAYLTRVAERAS